MGRLILTLGFFLLAVFFGGTRVVSFLPVMLVGVIAFCFMAIKDLSFAAKTLSWYVPFWLGLLFIIYLFLQLNNVWLYIDPHDGYKEAIILNFISWLPAGVESGALDSYSQYDIIAQAILVWSFLCALRLDLRGRNDCLYYAKVIFFSIFICGIAALLYKISFPYSYKIWGIMETYASNSYGSFIYKNQCAALLLLGIGSGFALTARNIRLGGSLIRTLILATSVILLFMSILFSGSMGACIVGGVMVLVSISVLIISNRSKFYIQKTLFVGLAGVLLLAIVSSVFFLKSDYAKGYFERIEKAYMAVQNNKLGICEKLGGDRYEYKLLSSDMIMRGGDWRKGSIDSNALARIVFGNGANSYCNVSPMFTATDSKYNVDFYSNAYHKSTGRFIVADAHCDILQFIFEYGLFWSAIIFTFVSVYIFNLFKLKFWQSGYVLQLAICLSFIFIYSIYDIIFYNCFISTVYLCLALILYEYSVFGTSHKKARL